MRSFGIVTPQFWTGKTGREIQKSGAEAIILATYLMTSPHSHMCGLYYLPKQYIVYDTGRSMKGVASALKDLSALPSGTFAHYDDSSEYVWVPEMLRHQVGELKPKDNRISGIVKWYRSLPNIPFLGAFYDRYHEEIPELVRRNTVKPEGASKGGIEGLNEPDKPPISTLGLGPDLDLGLEGSDERKISEVKTYGEFGHVLLTDEQCAKLEAQLGGHLERYIGKFDRWKEENKNNRKYKDRTAYLTIPNWYERDLADGAIQPRPGTVAKGNGNRRIYESDAEAKQRRTAEAADRLRARVAETIGSGISGGVERGDTGRVPEPVLSFPDRDA